MKEFDLIRKLINFKLNVGTIVLCTTIAFNIDKIWPTDLSFGIKLSISLSIALFGIFIYITVYSLLNDIIVDAHLYYNKVHEQIRRRKHVSQLQFDIRTPLKGITTTQLAAFIHILPPDDKHKFHAELKRLEETN